MVTQNEEAMVVQTRSQSRENEREEATRFTEKIILDFESKQMQQ